MAIARPSTAAAAAQLRRRARCCNQRFLELVNAVQKVIWQSDYNRNLFNYFENTILILKFRIHLILDYNILLAVGITTITMEELMKWCPDFREFARGGKEPAVQTASEKVDATVTTFLPKYSSAAQR